jgi:hypothetical protein
VRWRRGPGILWRTAPSYLVLATIDGRTVEVAGSGADVWARLGSWITEDEVAAALAGQYGAEERVVSSDVLALLQELHAGGYVDRDD